MDDTAASNQQGRQDRLQVLSGRLTRSNDDRVVAGLSAGIAARLGIPTVYVRSGVPLTDARWRVRDPLLPRRLDHHARRETVRLDDRGRPSGNDRAAGRPRVGFLATPHRSGSLRTLVRPGRVAGNPGHLRGRTHLGPVERRVQEAALSPHPSIGERRRPKQDPDLRWRGPHGRRDRGRAGLPRLHPVARTGRHRGAPHRGRVHASVRAMGLGALRGTFRRAPRKDPGTGTRRHGRAPPRLGAPDARDDPAQRRPTTHDHPRPCPGTRPPHVAVRADRS